LAILMGTVLSSLAIDAIAQSNGDFRSRRTGNWSQSNSWEEYTGGSWTNSGNTPDINDGQITIRSGHSITANVRRGNYDQLVIEAGGEIETSQVFKISDGPGVDLEVYGDFTVNRTARVLGAASALFHAASNTYIGNNDKLRFESTSTATFDGGSILTMIGTFQPEDDAVVQVNSGAYFTNDGTILVRDRADLTINQSTIQNRGLFRVVQNATATFANGSVYIHDQDGGYIPSAARTTWLAGSEVRISGVSTQIPTELDNNFAEFTWDATSQTSSLDLAAEILGISGDLKIESTGTGDLTWDNAGGSLSIGGAFTQTAGDFRFVDAGSGIMSVAGDFDVTGGIFDLASTSGNPILSVAGDFTVTSSLTESGSGFGTITFSGSSSQTITANGTLSGNVDVNVAGTASAVLADDFFVPGHFNETSGGLDFGSYDVEIEGDFGVTTSLSNPAKVTFSSANAAQLQLPAASNSLPNVLVDKPASTLTLLSDATTSTTIIVRNGVLDTNGFELLIPHGATLHNDDTVTGPVTIERNYSQNSDGWRMLASPVSGVSYSGLNSAFWTQGAPWATKIEGTTNLQSFSFASQDWTELGGADNSFSSSEGYIFYMYATDDLGASILPATWSVSGAPGALSTQSLQYGSGIADSYNLMSNPSTTNMDWNLTWAGSSNMESSYATWDPSVTTGGGTTGYKYYDASSGIGAAGRYIAPFTAFMVAANSNGAQIAMSSNEAAAVQTAVHYGKNDNTAPHVRLLLVGEGLAEDETYLAFGADASDETNLFDVTRLSPLSLDFATLWSDSNDRRLAFDGRTMETGREIYNLTLASTRSGFYSISIDETHEIPESWTITLVDLLSGKQVDLHTGDILQFHTLSSDIVTVDSGLDSERSPRFRLVVTDPDLAVDAGNDLFARDGVPVLGQNYPNPFNPSTTIRYSLPVSGSVKLDVFDLLGRQIAVLVDEQLSAGWHQATFLADNLSSGVYVYRLTVDGQSFSRKMLLLK